MSAKEYYCLSDSSIGQIAKLVQIAILTGTDVVDHLRLMKFDTDEGVLNPTAEYSASFEETIEKMVKETPEGGNNTTSNDKDDKLLHWEE